MLTPYLIDLAALRNSMGSKNENLISAIRERDEEKFNEDAHGMCLGRAVTQLVMGEKLDANATATYQYGYALEALCNEIGTVELPDVWGGVHWAAMEDTNMQAVLAQTGPPVELPISIGGFPIIGHLPRDRIQQMVDQMGEEGLTHEEEELQELLKEFEGWLRHAALQNCDLVLFCR